MFRMTLKNFKALNLEIHSTEGNKRWFSSATFHVNIFRVHFLCMYLISTYYSNFYHFFPQNNYFSVKKVTWHVLTHSVPIRNCCQSLKLQGIHFHIQVHQFLKGKLEGFSKISFPMHVFKGQLFPKIWSWTPFFQLLLALPFIKKVYYGSSTGNEFFSCCIKLQIRACFSRVLPSVWHFNLRLSDLKMVNVHWFTSEI